MRNSDCLLFYLFRELLQLFILKGPGSLPGRVISRWWRGWKRPTSTLSRRPGSVGFWWILCCLLDFEIFWWMSIGDYHWLSSSMNRDYLLIVIYRWFSSSFIIYWESRPEPSSIFGGMHVRVLPSLGMEVKSEANRKHMLTHVDPGVVMPQ